MQDLLYNDQVNNCIQLTLPMPPSINEQYATVNGRRVLSREARKFKKQVKDILYQLERKGVIRQEIRQYFQQCYIAIFFDFNFSSPHRRDLDGGLKIAQDAVCEALGLNDNKVVELYLTKHIDPLNPHLYIELKALVDWQFDKQYVVLSE